MAEGEQQQQGGGNNKKITLVAGLVLGVLLLEGVGVFLAVRMLGGGPSETVAQIMEEADPQHSEEDLQTEQILVTKLECPHTSTGRLYVISMSVYAVVPKSSGEGDGDGRNVLGAGHGEEGESHGGIVGKIEENLAIIKDRMGTIVARADASTLCLPGAQKPDFGRATLKRQFKAVLEEVCGKGKIKEVLIPDYMPTPLD